MKKKGHVTNLIMKRNLFNSFGALLVVLLIVSTSCKSQEQMESIRNFINDLSNDVRNDKLIKDYLSITDDSTRAIIGIVNNQIDELRNDVKRIDKKNLTYSPYHDVRDSNKDLILSESEVKNTFIIMINKERFLPILMDGDKIKSFSTINKGSKKVFLLL